VCIYGSVLWLGEPGGERAKAKDIIGRLSLVLFSLCSFQVLVRALELQREQTCGALLVNLVRALKTKPWKMMVLICKFGFYSSSPICQIAQLPRGVPQSVQPRTASAFRPSLQRRKGGWRNFRRSSWGEEWSFSFCYHKSRSLYVLIMTISLKLWNNDTRLVLCFLYSLFLL